MAPSTTHPALRWIAPVAAAVLAVGVPVTIAAQASAEPPLPPKTAQQLLVDLQGVRPRPLSGEVRQVANLGLPELPGFASPTVKDVSVGSLLTLASGTHSWRVWTDGAAASRVALVQPSGETDVIRNGTDLWVWSSADSSAVHSTLPTGTKGHDATGGAQRTPQQVADEILSTLDPTTEVTTERADRVAGRPVYELVLTPRQSDTKVGRVRLAVDAETTVPLRVQVFAHDGTDALDVAFTSVSFDTPDPGLFRFTAPAGTTVTEQTDAVAPARTDRPASGSATPAKPRVSGTGWSTVVVGESPAGPAAGTASDRSVAALLDSLPTVSGAWGQGRLLDSALVSVVLTDDGRVAAGAVTPEALYAALGAR